MIGIDTNVLLRLFLQDDADQHAKAVALLSRHQRDGEVAINAIVLVEFAWTLQRRKSLTRQRIAHYLSEVISAAEFSIEHAGAAETALQHYKSGKADFADYFLAAINAAAGCTRTFTFDRDAIDCPLFASVPE
jgi:predicted nucleic-acid-binding protein